MNIVSRREKIKRRSGTGRETTQRKRLDLDLNKGQRTGLTFNFENIEKMDGFCLPGSFFDQIKLPEKNTFTDYDNISEEEQVSYMDQTPKKESPVKYEEKTNISDIPKEQSFEVETNSPKFEETPKKLIQEQDISLQDSSPQQQHIIFQQDTPPQQDNDSPPLEQDNDNPQERITSPPSEYSLQQQDSPPLEQENNSPKERISKIPIQQENIQIREDSPQERISPLPSGHSPIVNSPVNYEQTPVKISEISNIEKVEETPERSISPVFEKTPKKKKNVSFSNQMDISIQTPNKHTDIEELIPVYKEIPEESEEEEEEIEYYNEVMNAEYEFDESFYPGDEEEEEEDEGIKKIEMSGIKNLRTKVMKPVEYWKGEKPEFEEGELKGKKRPKTPQKERKNKKKKVQENPEGKFPVIIKNGRETRVDIQQILQTKETCIEEKFRLIQEEDPTPIDVGIKVAFTNDHIKSGILEIKGKSRKPLQNTREYFEIFYCLQGSAEIQVHESKFRVSRGSHFMVPPFNNFAILNENNTLCRFCYFMSK